VGAFDGSVLVGRYSQRGKGDRRIRAFGIRVVWLGADVIAPREPNLFCWHPLKYEDRDESHCTRSLCVDLGIVLNQLILNVSKQSLIIIHATVDYLFCHSVV
jgi:hypothetical protein